MSSLTTAGSRSSMEECSAEFDTRLSLEIGETSRATPPPQSLRLFGELIISPQEQDHGGDGSLGHRGTTRAPVARRKRRAECGGVASGDIDAAGGGRQNKKAIRTLQSSEEDNGDRQRIPSDGGSRKKLRLTSAQAALLEDSFRAHNILTHAQKQELARRAGLSARQVQVWFQNRRARTKLKKTEVDCKLLRRWRDRLTDENERLRRDLDELRAVSAARLPAAAVSVVCPYCCDKKMVAVAGDVA